MKPEEIAEVINYIFNENGKEGLNTLTKKEFQESLFMTDFHQKLTLYFAP
jgi:hypothetical protein